MANTLADLLGLTTTDNTALSSLLQPTAGGNQLENLARMFLLSGGMKPIGTAEPRTVNIGGHNILDVTPRSGFEQFYGGVGSALGGLATGYAGGAEMKRQQDFLNKVGQVAQSGKDPEEIMNDLLPLVAQNPKMAKDLGLMDVITQYQKVSQVPIGVIDPLTGEFKTTGYVPKSSKYIQKKEPTGTTKKSIPGPQVDKISAQEDAFYGMGASQVQLEAHPEFNQFMGPGKQILRSKYRAWANKDLQQFLAWQAGVQDAFQQYRKSVTGAQASDKEIRMLEKNRPTQEDMPEVFVNKVKNLQLIGATVQKRYLENLGKAGYNVEGFEDTINNLDMEIERLKSEVENVERLGETTQTIQTFNSIEEATRANLPIGKEIRVINPKTGKMGRAVIE